MRGDKNGHLPAKNATGIMGDMKFCRNGHAISGENKLEFKDRVRCKTCTNAAYNKRYALTRKKKVSRDMMWRILYSEEFTETDKIQLMKALLK